MRAGFSFPAVGLAGVEFDGGEEVSTLEGQHCARATERFIIIIIIIIIISYCNLVFTRWQQPYTSTNTTIQ
jgi:hypothetical protein